MDLTHCIVALPVHEPSAVMTRWVGRRWRTLTLVEAGRAQSLHVSR